MPVLNLSVHRPLILCFVLLVIALGAAPAFAQSGPTNTRLLRFPDIRENRVVFTYAGDLWTASREGGQARRLTSHPGSEVFAKFSPDGKWIAFTADYDGNTDVYVMPSEGGEPQRLTYHPAPDQVLGWTPDSQRVLFRSTRTSFSQRFDKLFTVGVQGGMPEELPLPAGGLTSYSPDGSRIAYNRISTEFRTWKRYRGGWKQFVSIYNLKTNEYEELPHNDAADTFPMWYGDAIYFDSDRDGVMNLYCYDLKSKKTRKLTDYKEYDVKWPSLGGGDKPAIVYENGGYLYALDLRSEKAALLPINVESDMTLTRPTFTKAERFVYSFSLSPSGARALFGARGEIFTVPAKKGDVRDLTNTSGVRELWPTWSPDGKSIAYFSDKTGEYELYTRPQDGSGDEKRITTDSTVFRSGPAWSPDSTKILFAEKSLKLYYVDINTGKPVLIDQGRTFAINSYDWSPDSKWVAYAKPMDNRFSQIMLYSVDQHKSYAVTDGMSPDSSPVFDKGGKYLYFFSDRNFVLPSFSAFELNPSYNNNRGIYAVTLAADTPSPFAPESDEEKGTGAKEGEPKPPLPPGAGGGGERGKPGTGGAAGQSQSKPPEQPASGAAATDETPKKEDPKTATKPIKVDIKDIERRVINIQVPPGSYNGLNAGKEKIFYLASPAVQAPQGDGTAPPAPANVLHIYDLAKREDTVFLAGVNAYDTNPAGDKIIYRAGPVFGILDNKPGQKVGDGKIELGGLDMKLDPRAEWKQIFDEAWRIERDFYYDPTMRGLDWGAVKKRYEQELPYIAHRTDLNYLIGEMIAELSTSHSYVSGGDMPQLNRIGVGLLGADFDTNAGYIRIKKIYTGDNSSPSTRSPLTEPGVVVKEGEYLIAVNGQPLHAGDEPFAPFENMVGKQVMLRVNDKPSEQGARTVTVRPISSDTALRYLDWAENNRQKVLQATGGRCGYMHVPDTSVSGINAFAKAFYAQTDRDCLIVDERWNSGGFIPDFFVERLRRGLLSYYAPREGSDWKIPQAAIYGPKVMIVNEYAGSGGDAFPYYFRRYGIGTIVGKKTWGGLVGISGGLPMIDNGSVTAPTFAIWVADNGKSEWVVENKGVEPDIDVDLRPDLAVSGHDPQLEKAIEVINDQLKKTPPQHPARPEYGGK
jgi:tricorn protease